MISVSDEIKLRASIASGILNTAYMSKCIIPEHPYGTIEDEAIGTANMIVDNAIKKSLGVK